MLQELDMVKDRYRYHYDNGQGEFPGLGDNPNLAPLNSTLIRAQLTFLNENSIRDRERCVRILLNRIQDYYQVAGYVGPVMSKRSELGCVLGDWIFERGYEPWREKVRLTNNFAWQDPGAIFRKARYLCLASAIRLAAWEIGKLVPESTEAIKRAAWCAYSSVTELNKNWSSIRCRLGSRRMKMVIDGSISQLTRMQLVQSSRGWLGSFEMIETIKEAC